MKRMAYYILFLWIFLSTFTNSVGQVKLRSMVAFNYSYGITTASLNSFIPNQPFHGVNGDYRYFYKRNLSFGFHTGWNSFKRQFPRQVFETNKGTVSAIQTRFFYSFPLMVTAHYYLRSSKFIMPYIGGGLGPTLVNYSKWYSIVNFRDKSIQFGIAPEIGVIIPFKKSGLGLNLAGRYNEVFYSHEEIRNVRYFELIAGIYFGYF